MSRNIKILIVHNPSKTYLANEIVKGLKGRYRKFEIATLRDHLLSGEPLNLKRMVDDVSTVVILDDPNLFTDTITDALVHYSIECHKFLPVCDVEPSALFLLELKSSYLTHSPDPDDVFWDLLANRILINSL
ncbi:MAG: hypothetical protein UV68_C0039G0005 [Candidatus Collierbacteria bacterium GW2011_GWC2_43_12]|uniref:Uncharacterized protein n=1 Tax=Candidatus Collierbacteria bacterium GW2011_GWC2_43_12 TaxID=1618390 RepID=A0A0G1D4M7_9BACT|nr:MAG: hypothetical protein UV68_C0039G0005 [Candidatus Collierbacteria bacterium GW2011_GWC2_43_12]KKT82843.1 MAG: hypothetical protein UW80_C0029G0006 [Microgenomates group bacterium GW2011_GWC1_44_9]